MQGMGEGWGLGEEERLDGGVVVFVGVVDSIALVGVCLLFEGLVELP